MTRSRLLFTIAIVGLVAAPAAAQRTRPARGANSSRDNYRARIDTTIAFDKSGTVTINAGNGDISVTGVAGNQLHVRATSDDNDIRFDAAASRMSVDISTMHRGGDTRFEITVPFGVRVIAKTQAGDVSIRGTRGEVEVTAQSGDVRVEDVNGRLGIRTFSGEVIVGTVNGDVEVGTQSGDMTLTDVRGNIEIGNTSGDISMRGITAKLVRARTVSGDVTYDGTIDPSGRYELVSHSGDVGLHVPRDANAQLTISTWNGEVASDFPITLRPGEHGIGSATSKRFTFEIGGGSARITAETFSGDVTVSSNGRGATDRRP